MKEDFLHYLWKYKKFNHYNLKTSNGQELELVNPGRHNLHAGPDFFNSRLRISGQQWAGNVELHLKSSHWYMHGHEQDPAYDSVILHVVWDEDVEVFSKNDRALPTLILKNYVEEQLLQDYRKLFNNQQTSFINCERDFAEIPTSITYDWLERLYFERLERKVHDIKLLLERTRGDWEAVLFIMLARSFGTRINGGAFSALAGQLPFSVVRKARQREGVLEALLLGQAGLLAKSDDERLKFWKQEYKFLQTKFSLEPYQGTPVQFFKLRPSNFPGLRLAQLARVYEQHDQLFKKLMETQEIDEIRSYFKVKASEYWDTHYNFNKEHKKRPKRLNKKLIDLLIINAIVPLKFAYQKTRPSPDPSAVLRLMNKLPAEQNAIVDKYYNLRQLPKNALYSQALLQLKSAYCDPNRCLNCRIGNYLIGDKKIS